VNSDTIVIDASVLVAIFKSETDSAQLIERITSYKKRALSAATWLEAAIVCESASAQAGNDADFEELIQNLNVDVVSFTPEQARLAFEAFKRFGNGQGSKASLNFGDCFTYALAKELQAPLLFKGNDFAHTDLQRT
jgi:ribonuclease VapC